MNLPTSRLTHVHLPACWCAGAPTGAGQELFLKTIHRHCGNKLLYRDLVTIFLFK